MSGNSAGPAFVVTDRVGAPPAPEGAVVAADDADELTVLFRRLSSGDEQAFGEFYDLTASKVFAVIVGLVGEGTEAEKLLAATFLRLWESAASSAVVPGQELVWVLQLMFRCRTDLGVPNAN
ncbi:hypothetical protein [Arthrobacter rhombi]|uniref:hypothetical protein n=1 Tax=Arthrobacter rhombi TaxID=71253 RepID=UPI003FD0C678